MRTTCATWAIFLLAVITAGCGPEEPTGPAEPEQPAADSTADFDQDGLADVDEIKLYHTSPETRDSDGDGYDDYQEIHELGYDPTNPTKFNPLVADVPRIDIELTTPPKVTVDYRKSTGGTVTVETGRTKTTGSTVMDSESAEQNWSITAGGEVGYPWTVKISTSGTRGRSHSWTKQQSSENQLAISKMQSHSENKEITQEGGTVKVGVAITNPGHIPFTLENLALTAFRLEGTRWWPVTQLEAVSSKPFFGMGTWVRGERVELAFEAKNLNLSEVEELLTSDLLVQVSKHELKDVNGQAFGHRSSAIDAACARIVIDYGGKVPNESYMVSARTAPDERGIPLTTVLDTLGMPCQTGTVAWTYRKRTQEGQLATGDGATKTGQTRHGLLQLRDVAVNPQQGGYWLIVHQTPTAPSGPLTPHRYDLLEGDYKLEDICLKPHQTIQLAYIRDPDRDALSTPAEHALGTEPWQADTDGDGVADGDEIRDGTDPLRAVEVDIYSGYFVSNKFEPDAHESFVILTNQDEFDEVFGAAFVMNDKSHRLPKDAFKSLIVLAVIKRGRERWEYKVKHMKVEQGVIQLGYTATRRATPNATFACPLIISVPRDEYKAVEFMEDYKGMDFMEDGTKLKRLEYDSKTVKALP